MNRKTRNVLIGIAAVVVIGVVGGVAYFFSGSAPEAATLEEAVAAAEADQATPGTAPEDAPEPVPDPTAPVQDEGEEPAAPGVDGTWTVDTSVGEFSYADATSTFVGFRVGEVLSGVGETEAVGRTPTVTGSIEIEGSTVTDASIEARLADLTTDRSRRDDVVQRVLDTAAFPSATFELTTVADFGALPAEEESVSVTAAGDLTIKGTTRPVEILLDAQIVGDLIVAVGQIDVVFADFDVPLPSAPAVLSLNDFGVIEIQLFFSR